LYTLGDPDFKSPRLIDTIQVFPVWVPLEYSGEMRTEQLPQLMNTMGNSMTFPYFDIIPECKCRITLVFPDKMQSHIDKLLDQLKTMSLLNKRRATIEEIKEIVE